MLSRSTVCKVASFLEEHKDLKYDFSLVRLMHEEKVRRLNEHFRQLPIEKQREILEELKQGMNNETNEIDEED